ncbi:MAG: hypothetical protein Q8830_03625 [Candidatus Phytoplasma australasiaticum]|nr:hypothetical protein [Candidatus Phytoplasma australasiaticum]
MAVEMYEVAPEDEQATCDIGYTLGGHTHEFTPGVSGMTYQPTNTEIVPYMMPLILKDPSLSSLENIFGYRSQHFENALNFTSSPVSMSTDIPDIESNELDGSNDEVENESEGGELSVKENVRFFLSVVGLVL